MDLGLRVIQRGYAKLRGLFFSQDTTDISAVLTDYYQQILGRPPDAEGLAYWTRQFEAGASFDEIWDAICDVPEAQSKWFR